MDQTNEDIKKSSKKASEASYMSYLAIKGMN